MEKIKQKHLLDLTEEDKDEILLDLRANFLNGSKGKQFTFNL